MEKHKRRNQLVHQHSRQEKAFLRLIWYQQFLPVYHRISTLQSHLLRQEVRHNQRQRHRHHYALPQIPFIWQRDRLDKERPKQHVRRNLGQLRRSRGLWTYRTLYTKHPQRQIRLEQRRTLQRRRTGTFTKYKRTTIWTDKKRHHTWIQETRTGHYY